MRQNVASQIWQVFAFDRTDSTPKTGDAANITAKIKVGTAALAATNDTNPTEIEDGYYYFDLTQAETNGKELYLFPESSTSDIQVIGNPAMFVTVPLTDIKNELTSSAAAIGAALSGSSITDYKGDHWSLAITGLGNVSSRDNEKLWFTIKNRPGDSDDDALVMINETDGLTRINRQAAGTAANGSITVDDASAGDITVVLLPAETRKLSNGAFVYDVQYRAGTTITTMAVGEFKILPDVTHTPGA